MGGIDNRSVEVVVLLALGGERHDGVHATAMAMAGHVRRKETTMKYFGLALLALCCLVGCVEPAVPTGAAAEAPTELEITMDAPTTAGG